MQRWFSERAWMGGASFTHDVLVTTDKGRITDLTSGADRSTGRMAGVTWLDGVVLPGLVSAHSHAFHRALRGRTHTVGGDFWAWRTPMYTLAGGLDPDKYYRLAVDVFGEMVRSGVTTVGEFHYVHHQPDGRPYDDANAMGLALVAAAQMVGIRLTLIDAAYLASSVDGAPVTTDQRRFSDGSVDAWRSRVEDLASELRSHATVTLGLAAHSVRGVPADALVSVAATARDLETPLHIHVSEQPAENTACLETHGMSPVSLLASTGFLGPDTTLVHATHLVEHDLSMVAASGSIVCLCPTTEADLGDGIGPAAEFVAAGVPICLGSDSNAVIDVFREAWAVEQHDRLRLGRRGVHDPAELLTAATSTGMRSLGWSGGGLRVGSEADFIAVSMDSLDLAGTPGDLPSVVSSATRASVTDVVVAGRHIVGRRG
ncbi:MAG: formimidoylglutamate deiminase [Acidimicrobiia bacterium]|nr:formimidoylglutamate deiminase [Acidimicrobiia bacterium]